jgi:hypothetical protein
MTMQTQHKGTLTTLAVFGSIAALPDASLAQSKQSLDQRNAIYAPCLVIGALISLAVGFGITKLIWDLRQLQTVMGYLPAHLAVSAETGIILLVLALLLIGIVLIFGRWVFAKTARQSLLEG